MTQLQRQKQRRWILDSPLRRSCESRNPVSCSSRTKEKNKDAGSLIKSGMTEGGGVACRVTPFDSGLKRPTLRVNGRKKQRPWIPIPLCVVPAKAGTQCLALHEQTKEQRHWIPDQVRDDGRRRSGLSGYALRLRSQETYAQGEREEKTTPLDPHSPLRRSCESRNPVSFSSRTNERTKTLDP